MRTVRAWTALAFSAALALTARGFDLGAALEAAARQGGGQVIVPPGEYLSGPLKLCSHLDLELQAGAHVHFSKDRQAYADGRGATISQIEAADADDITLGGAGVLDGGGDAWWAGARKVIARLRAQGKGEPPNSRPRLLRMDRCRHIRIRGLTLENSPQITVLLSHCSDVSVENVTIAAPAWSPNTAGVVTAACSRVTIDRCRIDAGDDDIAINGGASERKPSGDIAISNCVFLHGHGCSIGSDTRGGIRRMTVSRCRFEGTEMGIRLKSARGRGGVVEDVVFEDLDMDRVGEPIVISSYYPAVRPRGGFPQAAAPFLPTTPVWRHILIRNVLARHSTGRAGEVYGLPESPITDITLKNVQIEASSELRTFYATLRRTP